MATGAAVTPGGHVSIDAFAPLMPELTSCELPWGFHSFTGSSYAADSSFLT